MGAISSVSRNDVHHRGRRLATQLFSITNYPVDLLVGQIDSGMLGLPDLQRPFVWSRIKVRDLFDSLYRGYPAGYFLLWNPPSGVDSHGIGADSNGGQAQKMIVDGQQRLTSLYAVMKAREIINEDNETQLIRIAFNPLTGEFAVANAASDNDPEWLSNISEVWTNAQGSWAFTNDFIESLGSSRLVSDQEKQEIGEALSRLDALRSYQFSALELSAELDIEVVAEVFQRINSTGVGLNSADFILTLMSVYWKEGRHALEDFARAAKKPSTGSASPYNHFYQPSPDQLLRVAVGFSDPTPWPHAASKHKIIGRTARPLVMIIFFFRRSKPGRNRRCAAIVRTAHQTEVQHGISADTIPTT